MIWSSTAAFLLGHVPSFTNAGYVCRKSGWKDITWNFSGQRWLVTGASAGIGREIARAAADAGATVLDQRGLLQSDATIITMSSGGMYGVALTLVSLAHQKQGDGVLAYARHKRAQVALNAYWRDQVAPHRQYYVMHPGWVDTPGVERSLPLFRLLLRPLLRDAVAGADTALWLAQRRPGQSSAE